MKKETNGDILRRAALYFEIQDKAAGDETYEDLSADLRRIAILTDRIDSVTIEVAVRAYVEPEKYHLVTPADVQAAIDRWIQQTPGEEKIK